MKDTLNGNIIPALLTPYTKTGALNKESLKKHIEVLIGQGVAGFYLNGTTGEGLLLDEEERMEAVVTAAEAINKRAKLIVQVGSLSTKCSQRMAAHAAKNGADAVSSLPPLYFKYTFDQIKEHYIKIAESAGIPMIVYNIPSYSGVPMSVEQLKTLAEHPLIKGIKHSSPNVYELERFKANVPEMTVYYGMDEQYLAGRIMGADAFIGSTYNVMTPIYKKLEKAYVDGNKDDMKTYTTLLNGFTSDLIKADIMPALKYIIETKLGIEFNGCRTPLANELTAEGKAIADNVYSRMEKYL